MPGGTAAAGARGAWQRSSDFPGGARALPGSPELTLACNVIASQKRLPGTLPGLGSVHTGERRCFRWALGTSPGVSHGH
jgi:hypothetical protein